jgi:hypothetical protein
MGRHSAPAPIMYRGVRAHLDHLDAQVVSDWYGCTCSGPDDSGTHEPPCGLHRVSEPVSVRDHLRTPEIPVYLEGRRVGYAPAAGGPLTFTDSPPQSPVGDLRLLVLAEAQDLVTEVDVMLTDWREHLWNVHQMTRDPIRRRNRRIR